MSFPRVSVIIPVYNAEETIAESIEAVLSQQYQGEMELLIIDDGSLDGTARIVKAFTAVRYFYQENSGPAAARNRGAEEAKGEILLFTDSDCIPCPGWIQGMVNAFDGDPTGVVAGSYGIANPREMLARIIHGEIRFRHLKLMPVYPKVFGSYNFAIRKALFGQVMGFKTTYRQASGEDNDLSYRILSAGARIRFVPEVCVKHFHQHELGRYLKEQFRHGFWRASLYFDHKAMVGGDGYTFWKDTLEVLLSLAIIINIFNLKLLINIIFCFILFEILFSYYIFGFSLDAFMAGWVFCLRSFARTAGLISGIFGLAGRRNNGRKKK